MRPPHSHPVLNRASAAAVRRLIESVTGLRRGIPFHSVLRLANALGTETQLTIDLESAHRIGVPVVVIHGPAPRATGSLLQHLSGRERQVALLVAQGHANKQVATELGITLATVKDHVHRILTKTGCASRGELTAKLAREDV